MLAWVHSNAGVSSAEVYRLSKTARRVFQLPVTFDAWSSGSPVGRAGRGCGRAPVRRHTVGMFAEPEPSRVPLLERLDVRATTAAMAVWRQHADALIDVRDGVALRRELHLSRTLAGRGRGPSRCFDPAATP